MVRLYLDFSKIHSLFKSLLALSILVVEFCDHSSLCSRSSRFQAALLSPSAQAVRLPTDPLPFRDALIVDAIVDWPGVSAVEPGPGARGKHGVIGASPSDWLGFSQGR